MMLVAHTATLGTMYGVPPETIQREENPFRKLFQVLAAFGTPFSLGLALLSNHPIWALALLLSSVAYLGWEVLTARSITNYVPPMFRLLIGLLGACMFLAVYLSDITTLLRPQTASREQESRNQKPSNPDSGKPELARREFKDPPAHQVTADHKSASTGTPIRSTNGTDLQPLKEDVMGLINAMSVDAADAQEKDDFWASRPATSGVNFERQKNHEQFDALYKNQYMQRTVDLYKALLRHISHLPPRTSREDRKALYDENSQAPPSFSLVFAKEQCIDLCVLLNEAETERGAAATCPVEEFEKRLEHRPTFR